MPVDETGVKDQRWRDARVLITGVCGTVGSELLNQVERLSPAEIVGFDNNESELFFLQERFRGRAGVRFVLGDVRDRDSLTSRNGRNRHCSPRGCASNM